MISKESKADLAVSSAMMGSARTGRVVVMGERGWEGRGRAGLSVGGGGGWSSRAYRRTTILLSFFLLGRWLILACQDRQGTPHVSESASAPVPSSTPKLIVWVRVLIARWSRPVTRAGRQARCLTRLLFSWRCYWLAIETARHSAGWQCSYCVGEEDVGGQLHVVRGIEPQLSLQGTTIADILRPGRFPQPRP